MKEVKLHVELLDFSKDSLALIYAAYRQCYSARFAGKIFSEATNKQKEISRFVAQMASSSHQSPLEHVKFTFALEGVSRALTHQLVRHRLASYSQQSQRYVNAIDFAFIIPPSIKKDKQMKKEYVEIMQKIQKAYCNLVERFKEKGIEGERANQDARFVLPQATETKIVVTMNCRELIHFFEERCCQRAQWEIKGLAEKMLKICKKKLPSVFGAVGAKCVRLGYCPEGARFSCGRYPLKEEILSYCRNFKPALERRKERQSKV